MNKALFLDRDGVINIDKEYLYKIEEFEFVDGIFELCEFFQDRGYIIFVITNQAGIGRGYYNEDDFEKLTEWMIKEFNKKEIDIKDIFYCPHHPKNGLGKYKIKCNCRKPEPEMIIKAKNLYNIDLNNSLLIGDKKSDILAGINAGIKKNYLIKSEYQDEFDFENLRELLRYIKGER